MGREMVMKLMELVTKYQVKGSSEYKKKYGVD